MAIVKETKLSLTDEELLKDIANELRVHNAISISSKMFEQDRIGKDEHEQNLDCLYDRYFTEK